ncbi:MAG: PHP domain-containing protein [Candidatus Cloacimonadota bacterium]|nr:PHP domain-containing protein [Candidatus Cloacimonadota bacterium]
MNRIDLHIHSTASDGYLSVEKILKLVAGKEYDTISITDHDTINGYLEAKKIGENYRTNIIAGVEISSLYNDVDVHILAYLFDETNAELLELLEFIKNERLVRAKKIIEKLAKLGMIVELERIYKIAGNDGLIGRPHFAQALLDLNYVRTLRQAFDDFLGDDGPCFQAKIIPDPQKVIEIIHNAGGIAVVAHPNRLPDVNILQDLIQMGIDGLEVFMKNYNYYPQEHEMFKEIAAKNNLLMTGGTDFHGKDYEIENFGKFSLEKIYLDKLIKFKENKNG